MRWIWRIWPQGLSHFVRAEISSAENQSNVSLKGNTLSGKNISCSTKLNGGKLFISSECDFCLHTLLRTKWSSLTRKVLLLYAANEKSFTIQFARARKYICFQRNMICNGKYFCSVNSVSKTSVLWPWIWPIRPDDFCFLSKNDLLWWFLTLICCEIDSMSVAMSMLKMYGQHHFWTSYAQSEARLLIE